MSERAQEIRRRRKRKKSVNKIKRKATKASVSDKAALATKLRRLTPGAEQIISQLGLVKSK